MLCPRTATEAAPWWRQTRSHLPGCTLLPGIFSLHTSQHEHHDWFPWDTLLHTGRKAGAPDRQTHGHQPEPSWAVPLQSILGPESSDKTGSSMYRLMATLCPQHPAHRSHENPPHPRFVGTSRMASPPTSPVFHVALHPHRGLCPGMEASQFASHRTYIFSFKKPNTKKECLRHPCAHPEMKHL